MSRPVVLAAFLTVGILCVVIQVFIAYSAEIITSAVAEASEDLADLLGCEIYRLSSMSTQSCDVMS